MAYRPEEVKSERKKIECICPDCGKTHKRLIFWIGRGTPRKFCQKCIEKQDKDTSPEDVFSTTKRVRKTYHSERVVQVTDVDMMTGIVVSAA